MPRSYLIEEDHIKAEADKTGHAIKVQIVAAETDRNISRAETIEHSGMSPASFYKAWKHPSLFRISQLVRIYEYLKIPQEERRYV